MRLRTVIADDHSVVVEGLERILVKEGCELVGIAETGQALLQLVDEVQPDLVVLDVSMPVLNGIEAARQIRKRNSKVKLLFLSMHSEPVYVREAFRAGGDGYVLKSSAAMEVGVAVKELLQGRYYLPDRIAQTLPDFMKTGVPGAFGSDLTPRQRQVLQLVAEGKTAKEIASILNISVKTVEFHKSSIMDTVGVRTIAELTRYALHHKLVSDAENN